MRTTNIPTDGLVLTSSELSRLRGLAKAVAARTTKDHQTYNCTQRMITVLNRAERRGRRAEAR